MKFLFNRKKNRVEPVQDIPDQQAKAAKARQILGMAPLPPPSLYDPLLGLDDIDFSPGAVNRVTTVPPSTWRNVSGGNRQPPSSLYGSSPGASGIPGCPCPVCTRTVVPSPGASWQSIPYAYIPNAGIRAGELVAWRFWRVESLCGLLKSASMQNIWYPGVPMTGKVREAGVFSWRERDFGLQECRNWLDSSDRFFVFGSIYHWGEVIEHEHGYRSERAEIRSLDCIVRSYPTGPLPDLDYLRKLYMVKP